MGAQAEDQPAAAPAAAPMEPALPRGLQVADSLVLLCAAVCAAIAFASLLLSGGQPVPPGPSGQTNVPMAPVSALVFLLFSGALVLGRENATLPGVSPERTRVLAKWVPAATALVGLVLWWLPILGVPLTGWVSGGSGFTFFLVGSAFVLRRSRRRAARWAAVAIEMFFLALLFVILLWLLYVTTSAAPVPVFSGIAIVSVVAFLALLVGQLFLEVPSGFMRVVISDSPAGEVVRRLLPAGFVLPPLFGWLRLQGEFSGLYDTSVGTTLFASSLVGLFAVVAALSARAVRRQDVRRREAEAAVRQREEWFATAFKASPAAMTITDAKTHTFIDLNPAAEALLGVIKVQAEGKTSVDLGLVPPVERDARAARVAKEGRLLGTEMRLTPRTGTPRTVLASIDTMDFRGRDVFLTVMVDITDRKKAEEEVLRSRNALAEAQRIGHVGAWEWDVVNDKAVWSEELFHIFGVDAKDHALGYAQAVSYIHPDDREVFAADVKDAVDGKGPYQSEYRILRGGSEMRYLHSQGEVIRGSDGKAVRMIGFVQDVTERKAAEDAIFRSREDLTLKAAELSRSNSELEQFAYVASHDLQEPLRMVASYVQLLKKRYGGKLDADADEFIQFAVEGAQRMQGLIDDLLTYSRVGTRGKPFVPTDSAAALKTATDNLEVAISESRAVIRAGPLPTVTADATQLTQLFQNLLSNAIKYRRDKDPEIAVSARREAGAWLFAVADNGIGIDPAHFDRIFIIFQRLQARDETSGSGIGLALCKKIVERHGGRIWVESQPGKGSTFLFTIPDNKNIGGAKP